MKNESLVAKAFLGFTGLMIIFTATVVLMASCNKQNQSPEAAQSICVTRAIPKVSDYKVTGNDLDSIFALFSANNLSTANLQFFSWLTDTTTNIYPTQYSGYQEQVLATRFINGLPVFADDEFFTFNAGKFQPGGVYDGYTGPAPSGDTTGNQNIVYLREAFLAHVSESFMEGGVQNSKPFIPSASSYVDACLTVTLGYLDASFIPGNPSALNQALVKVWSVRPTYSSSISYYPLIYVEDAGGLAWGVVFISP
jgi:hypothetical protein